MKKLFILLFCFVQSVAFAREPIDIFYGTDNGYIVHVGVSIASILSHVSKDYDVRFHILADSSVSQETRDQFKALQKIHPHFLEFIDVDELKFKDLAQYKGSKGTYYRFMIPSLSKADKALYLDGDTLIRGDIQELWNTDISDSYLGAILDYPEWRVKNAI